MRAIWLTVGSLSVTALAMAIAVPFGLGAAIYISEFAGAKEKEILKVVIELLAALLVERLEYDPVEITVNRVDEHGRLARTVMRHGPLPAGALDGVGVLRRDDRVPVAVLLDGAQRLERTHRIATARCAPPSTGATGC